MKLTDEKKKEILDAVIEQHFCNAPIERLVLEYLYEKSLQGKRATTNDICAHLKNIGEETSAGAVRGTIMRIRHKLLKYREQAEEEAFHLIFPEKSSPQGYLLQFERNSRQMKSSVVVDPWLVKNWEVLKGQGIRGFWKGLSLPDGGRGPIKLYTWVNSLSDPEGKEERFMFLINSPSLTRPRIGMIEGEIKNCVLSMEGKWSAVYPEKGMEHFQLNAQIWPFRRSEKEPVGFAGRFILSNEEHNPYQQGQIELTYCPLESLNTEDLAAFVAKKE